MPARCPRFWRKKTAKKDKQASMWEKLSSHKAREFMVKDAKTGKMKDTGVRFADIAGMDHIVFEMREVVKLLIRDPQYTKVRATVLLSSRHIPAILYRRVLHLFVHPIFSHWFCKPHPHVHDTIQLFPLHIGPLSIRLLSSA